ncbi:hypothetical protein SBV1_590027 [Verrucomicrobia bacterium]|nr:hypothetical protein SBV1_590027 [Verrucomicrobiota bacterium]
MVKNLPPLGADHQEMPGFPRTWTATGGGNRSSNVKPYLREITGVGFDVGDSAMGGKDRRDRGPFLTVIFANNVGRQPW